LNRPHLHARDIVVVVIRKIDIKSSSLYVQYSRTKRADVNLCVSAASAATTRTQAKHLLTAAHHHCIAAAAGDDELPTSSTAP